LRTDQKNVLPSPSYTTQIFSLSSAGSYTSVANIYNFNVDHLASVVFGFSSMGLPASALYGTGYSDLLGSRPEPSLFKISLP